MDRTNKISSGRNWYGTKVRAPYKTMGIGIYAINSYAHKLYSDDDVLCEFGLLGFEDHSVISDTVPHFGICPNEDDYSNALLIALSETITIYAMNDKELPLYDPLFESDDIWEIWSVIRSNSKERVFDMIDEFSVMLRPFYE